MTQDKLREMVKDYLKVTPIGLTGFSKRVGISYVTLKRFIDGGVASVKVWKKMEDFIGKSVLHKDPYEIISNNT